jgi:putative transposase
VTVFRFVERERASFPVVMLCRVLGVSPSGFWAWLGRRPSARAEADEALTERIAAIHRASRGTYGAPRIRAELAAGGVRCGRKRVARLMRRAGLAGVHRRRRRQWAAASQAVAAVSHPDLVGRDFRAAGPDRLWVADITYLPTGGGFLHLAVVIDAWSRFVVGWSMAAHVRTELVTTALEMAIGRRRPMGRLIHHSDRGSQYTSLAFGQRLAEVGIAASVGSVGDAYDNALAESFFASLETELIDRSSWPSRAAARLAVFEYIEAFYNRQRRHSALGQLSPEEFERRYRSDELPAA